MNGHTPGPWDCDDEIHWENTPGEQEIHTGNFDVYTNGGDVVIANVNGQIDEGRVNARLIRAAPETAAERDRLKSVNTELLAALEEISKGKGGFSMDAFDHAINTIADMKEIATAAIAKAKETPQ